MSPRIKSLLEILAIVALFALSSYLVRQNIDFLKSIIGNDFGILFYILIAIFAVVVAPVSMMPLIPLASGVFGGFYAAIFNIIGWTLGSFIVFFISRKYGVPLIKKFVSLEKMEKFENKIPKENLFLDLILLRMIIPVDVLSYGISLFTKIDFRTFALTTFIGIIPFAFVFSYLGTIPLKYQIIGILIAIFIIGAISEFHKKLK
ncbi:TVP38/TMEM64 family protein [Candidatus Pacearchaeota archaeon]|nr:TVP38/TMEM64 family protein [Candidatus Pacearchaeota archaeon]